ncbi:MAG: hypothetical protein GY703_21130, partial [Gammaproteobacteria bacterium]|nr:hypothetical protein [Gammaproteobacteria bacterium]
MVRNRLRIISSAFNCCSRRQKYPPPKYSFPIKEQAVEKPYSQAGLTGLLLVFMLQCLPEAAFAVQNHSGTISVNTTWSAADVHLITGNVTVSSAATLTIAPGAVVKFNASKYLTIQGGLSAVGTAEDRIVFTSYRDDSIGGDTNGDGASTGQPGDWNSIQFNDSTNESTTELNYVDVRYGGNGSSYNIYIYRANFPIRNSEITHSAYYGLYLQDNTMVLEDNRIADNASEAGIYFYRGS